MNLNFPSEQDNAEDKQATSTIQRNPRRFSMLPAKDREIADNKLLFSAFQFNKFAYFKNWPNLSNWYLRFFVHYVQVPTDEGRVYQQMVICERETNRYAKDKLTTATLLVPPPLSSSSCEFCEEASSLWGAYKDARKAAGIGNLTTDEFWNALNAHPDIKDLYEKAKSWTAAERVYFVVWDYAKFIGEKALDKDETDVRFQGYWGPDRIQSLLYNKQKAKYKFWDFENGGARIVIVTRDNSRGARFCEYQVEIENDAPQLDGAVVAYLQSNDDVPDPCDDVKQWNSEQKRAYIEAFGEVKPQAAQPATEFTKPAVTVAAPPRVAPRPVARPTPPPAAIPTAEVHTPTAVNESVVEPAIPRRPKVNWR